MTADKKTSNFIAYLQAIRITTNELVTNSMPVASHPIQEIGSLDAQKILNLLKDIANNKYNNIKTELWYQCLGSIKTSNNEVQISLIMFICDINANIYQLATRRPQGQVYNYDVGNSSDAQLRINNLIII